MNMILLISCMSVFQGASGEKGDTGEPVSVDIVYFGSQGHEKKFMLYVITELRVSYVFQGKVGLTGPIGPPGQKVNSSHLSSSLLLMQ